MVSFLFRNLKGYRFLIVIAVAMTFAQVGADILVAFPLKIILDKIINCRDPNLPPFLNSILTFFNHFGTPAFNSFNCAGKPARDTVLGVILFSACAIIVLGIISAILAYIGLFLANSIAHNLSARLRKQLFGHLERLSLDWHGKQKKGDLVQRITGNIADIEKLVTDGLVDLLGGTLTLLGVATVMFIISPSYTLISLAI